MALIDLLDDFTIAQIARVLPSPLNAPLRSISARMRALIEKPQQMNADDLLRKGALMGSLVLCHLARANGATCTADMWSCAAEGGHYDICVLALRWGVCLHEILAAIAARFGQRAICELAHRHIFSRKYGDEATFELMLIYAAQGDTHDTTQRGCSHDASCPNNDPISRAKQRELCILARSWGLPGDYNFNELLCVAAEGGFYEKDGKAILWKQELCDLAREWGAIAGQKMIPEGMLIKALREGIWKGCNGHRNVAIRKLAREWGARQII